MHLHARILTALISAAAAFLVATPASAQMVRTYVSGVGDDANPCSRTAPCKTFAGAISKTAAAGEINCLDSAGFGAVTITKSITILCQGVVGGVAAQNSTGITINAAETDRVMLSGLDINGGGNGNIGIRVMKAGSVVIRDTIVYGFAAPASRGISVEGVGQVLLDSSAIVHNTTGVFGPVKQGNGNLIAANGADLVPK